MTCFSPLARGWLAASEDNRSQTDIYRERNYGDALDLKICAMVQAIATKHGATMAEVALAWVLSKEAICNPVVGAGSVSQLEDNVKALDLDLKRDGVETLDRLDKPRDVINDHVRTPMPRHLGGVLTES